MAGLAARDEQGDFDEPFTFSGMAANGKPDIQQTSIVCFALISEIPGASLRRRQKQRNYSGLQSEERGADQCERTGMRQMRCSSLPERHAFLARPLAENSTSQALCRSPKPGRDPLLRRRR